MYTIEKIGAPMTAEKVKQESEGAIYVDKEGDIVHTDVWLHYKEANELVAALEATGGDNISCNPDAITSTNEPYQKIEILKA